MQHGRNRLGPNLFRFLVPLGLSLLAAALTHATRTLEAYAPSPHPLPAAATW
jgi:hypothetical protein